MSNRTMVKLTALDHCISFQTVSRRNKASGRFLIARSALAQLQENGYLLVQDCYSYAKLTVNKANGVVTIQFSWLDRLGNDRLQGREETVLLPYDTLLHFARASREGETLRLLSIEEHSRPKLDFSQAGNLSKVAADKRLRHKLARFLRDNFNWRNTEEIRFYDDCIPYSFFFREYRNGAPAMCGGVILHGQDNMKTAYYAIHT